LIGNKELKQLFASLDYVQANPGCALHSALFSSLLASSLGSLSSLLEPLLRNRVLQALVFAAVSCLAFALFSVYLYDPSSPNEISRLLEFLFVVLSSRLAWMIPEWALSFLSSEVRPPAGERTRPQAQPSPTKTNHQIPSPPQFVPES
jgi:hypothetical protein